MQFKNTQNSFGIVSIIFHWVMAIMIIGLLTLGLYMTDMPQGAKKFMFYGWHKEFGVLVGILAILRLLWRLINTTPSLGSTSYYEKIAARSVHWIFYVLMVTIPITGWLMNSTGGHTVSFFGWLTLPIILQKNHAQHVIFKTIHFWLAYSMISFISLHSVAALKHHFIDHDNIFKRILWP